VQALLPYLNIAQILVCLLLILVILLQTRGTGLAASYSPDSSIFRTRRGVERTLFQLTIALSAVFVILAVASVIVVRIET
jgi:preprotein translocase subunit SecG